MKQGIICLAAGSLVVWLSLTGSDFDLRKSRTARLAVKSKTGRKEFGGDSDTFTASPYDSYGEVAWDSVTTYASEEIAANAVTPA